MLLAIDAGNTNVVFALVDGGEIRSRWRIASDPRRTADEYAVWLHQLLELEGHPKDAVDAVIIGSCVALELPSAAVEERDRRLRIGVGQGVGDGLVERGLAAASIDVGQDLRLLGDLAVQAGHRLVVRAHVDEADHRQAREQCEQPCEQRDPESGRHAVPVSRQAVSM